MSFHASAEHIRVDDGHILRAVLHNSAGEAVEAEFDLNTVLGNNNGSPALLRLLFFAENTMLTGAPV